MSRGVYLHWIKWKLFICSLVPVVSTSTRYWGICLYRPDHSVAYSIPGIILTTQALNKSNKILCLSWSYILGTKIDSKPTNLLIFDMLKSAVKNNEAGKGQMLGVSVLKISGKMN